MEKIQKKLREYFRKMLSSRLRQGIALATCGIITISLAKYARERLKARKMLKKASSISATKLSKPLPNLNLPSEAKQSYILSLKAFELSTALHKGDLTPLEVLSTYISRAFKLGRSFHISAEEPFIDALSRVPSLPKGQLYGIPISIKDEIFQLSCHSSGGVIWLAESLDDIDSILITQLREEGAVPFIRGSAMQLMMWWETVNNLYGRAENPWDRLRTPGGSSGGDAGLVACSATPLAIGSDIAGSIRIPAAFCGIYGFKPTSRRITSMECVATHKDSITPLELVVKASYGPLGRCVEDLVLVMKAWWQERLWRNDNMVVPLRFNHEVYEENRKLKIGYFDDNGVFEPAGVVKKVVQETVEALKNMGHEMVRIRTDMIEKGLELFVRATYAVEPGFMSEELQGEDPAWMYMRTYYDARYPFARHVIPFIKQMMGYKKLAHYMSLCKSLSFKEFCCLTNEISSFKFEFNSYWQGLGLDAAVCPIWPLVAPLHETTVKISHAFSYACFWNLLDFPAGVVPIRCVGEGEAIYESEVKDRYVDTAKDIMRGSEGLPVAIQVVCSTFQDEKALRLMKIIQDHFNFFKLKNE